MVGKMIGAQDSLDVSQLSDVALPRSSRIEVVESSDERLVVFIRGSRLDGLARAVFALFQVLVGAIGCGALLYLGVLIGAGMTGWFIFGIVLVQGIAGGARFVEWLRRSFAELCLFVEPGRFVTQRVLFGRKQIRETLLGPQSSVEVVNYGTTKSRIHVNGSDGPMEFGGELGLRDQEWLAGAINRFVATDAVPIPAVRRPDGMIEEIPPMLGREQLQFVPRIVVEEASNDRLCYRRRVYGGSRELYLFLVSELIVFAFIEVTLQQQNGGPGWFFGIVAPLFEGVILLAITLTLIGTLKIEVTAEAIRADWGFGPLHIRRRIRTERLTRIVVRYPAHVPRGFASRFSGSSRTPAFATCLAVDGKHTFILNNPGDLSTARRIGGILRSELAGMGRPTDDV